MLSVYDKNTICKGVMRHVHPAGTVCCECHRQKTGVLLSVKQYEKLLEDLHDLAVIAERRDEEPIALEEMKRRLQ